MIMLGLKGKYIFFMVLAMVLSTSCEDETQGSTGPRLTEQTFLAQAATGDIFHISIGNMAAQKGSSAEVRTFGARLAADYNQYNQELKVLAKQRAVTLPQIMPQANTQQVINLQNANGKTFDKQFTQIQLEASQEAIKLYEKAGKDLTDTQMQAFIHNSLPGMRIHLQEVKRLSEMVH